LYHIGCGLSVVRVRQSLWRGLDIPCGVGQMSLVVQLRLPWIVVVRVCNEFEVGVLGPRTRP
jgi:hypothetical protein